MEVLSIGIGTSLLFIQTRDLVMSFFPKYCLKIKHDLKYYAKNPFFTSLFVLSFSKSKVQSVG